jgi:exodeoxyribonuclease VII small subunit
MTNLPLDQLSFEQAFEELNSIVQQLESGELTLEESVTLYQRGRTLSAHCQALLDRAELRVNQLNEDGSVTPLS